MIYKLVSTERLMRITENRALVGENEEVFTENHLFEALYDALFEKTKKGKSLDMFDRISQKNYVDVLTVDRNKLLEKTKEKTVIDEKASFTNIHFTYIARVSDIATSKRAALEKVLTLLNKRKNRGDQETRAHYSDLIARINYNLNN